MVKGGLVTPLSPSCYTLQPLTKGAMDNHILIPFDILQNKSITTKEKIILGLLLSDQNEYVPSLRYFKQFFPDLTSDLLFKHLQNLEQNKYIGLRKIPLENVNVENVCKNFIISVKKIKVTIVCIRYYNIIINNINNICIHTVPTLNSLSSSSQKSQNPIGKFPEKVNIFVRRWNIFPNVRKHTNVNSDTYKIIDLYFTKLKQGKFHKIVELNQMWLDEQFIDQEFISKKWTQREIVQTLIDLAKFFVVGYWPPNKTRIPKGLDALIFNPRTGKSWFLLAAINGMPMTLMENVDVEITSETKMIVNRFLELRKLSPNKIQDINLGVETIQDYYKYTSHSNNMFVYHFPTLPNFLTKYMEFIEQADWIKQVWPGIFNSKNTVFSLFIKQITLDFSL